MRRSRSPASDCDVVEVRAEARRARARGRGRAARRAAPRSAARPRTRARRRRARAHRPLARSAASSSVERLAARGDQLRAELGDLLRPRRNRVARREAGRDAAERGVPLRDRGAVLRRQPRARREQPPERAVEVRAAHRGPALDDREPVGREDERRDLARAAAPPRAAARRSASRACPRRRRERDVELERRRRRGGRAARRGAAASPKRISCASVRVRGEKPCVPTCSDSSRFVLPAPFGPTTSTRPGVSPSSSARVRAEVAERDRLDDQVRGKPDRHDQVREVVVLALENRGPQAG